MRAFSLGVLLFLAQDTWACGHCVEDKIAGVYDHGAVTAALGARHAVVFFGVDGAVAPGQRAQIGKIAASVPGVDRGSVRISIELASLAIAFDPRRTTLVAVQKDLERKLATLRLSLFVLRVMDQPGDLAELRRPG